MKIKAVFFDAGETLIYRNPSLETIALRYLKRADYEMDLNKLRSVMKSSAFEMKGIIEKAKMNDSEKWTAYMEKVFSKLRIKNDVLLNEIKLRAERGTSFRAYKDVKETVKKLKKLGIKVGIISNASNELFGILKRVKILNIFDHIIVSEIAGAEKPDIRIFNIALRKAGVKKSEFVYVGDNYLADVKGAKHAEIKPVWILRKTDHALFAYDKDGQDKDLIVIKNLKELINIVEKQS